MTRVLVCGGRDFEDQTLLSNMLDLLHVQHSFSCLIEGEQRGADILARTWACWRGILYMPFPMDKRKFGAKWAGPMRNKQMLLEGRPEMVVAFDTGGPGTANMLRQSRLAKLPEVVFDCRRIPA